MKTRNGTNSIVTDLQALTVYLETETIIGDTVDLAVLREGALITIPVTLGEEPQV